MEQDNLCRPNSEVDRYFDSDFEISKIPYSKPDTKIDEDRVRKAEKAGEEETKQARKRARMVRKKLIDDDKAKEQDYEAEMF
ncbi:hypothetical protein J6590_048589 [Homalodisca vitripennis]|nr:hypothetical protein J6590_048589 [Homalodisca vitripennis]